MSISLTLSRYLARQYALWFLIFMAGLAGIIFMFELAELFRRAADVPGATFGVIMEMGFFKLPNTIERILPFVVLFAGMFTFWRLTKSQELVIARAAGISAWQFLSPAVAVTLLFGFINITMVNPLGSAMNARFKNMEGQFLRSATSMELTGAGLWLRQTEDNENGNRHFLLHADRVTLEPLTLIPLIVFIYDKNDKYYGRIDAPQAILDGNQWKISDAWLNFENKPPQHIDNYQIKTNLTLKKIQESMAAPNTVSFWELPAFVRALKAIGLPAVQHELQFEVLLAEPLFLCAMVFFAAAFSLRIARRGGIIQAILAGMFTGSILFSLNNVVTSMGVNQTLPITLAAWAIPVIALAAGNAALLYLEDG